MTDPEKIYSGRFNAPAMGKEERRLRVLNFLAETNLALPPRAVYINLKRQGITFSYKSVVRYLGEMDDEGLVNRLDENDSYYFISKSGREHLEDHG